MMANEKRLIDANALLEDGIRVKCGYNNDGLLMIPLRDVTRSIKNAPTVDAVEAKKYEALVEMYHDLRENFIDYYCSGTPNVAPYCLNRCEECLTPHGWCKALSDKCRGFNPAEVILDGERKDNDNK